MFKLFKIQGNKQNNPPGGASTVKYWLDSQVVQAPRSTNSLVVQAPGSFPRGEHLCLDSSVIASPGSQLYMTLTSLKFVRILIFLWGTFNRTRRSILMKKPSLKISWHCPFKHLLSFRVPARYLVLISTSTRTRSLFYPTQLRGQTVSTQLFVLQYTVQLVSSELTKLDVYNLPLQLQNSYSTPIEVF